MYDLDLINRIEAVAAEAVAVLRATAPSRDWLDEVLDDSGDALKTDEAAFVMGVHIDTMRDRAKAAASAGKPIGFLMASAVWLYSKRRILASIETEKGLPARLAAETRAEKSAKSRSLPGNSLGNRVATGS